MSYTMKCITITLYCFTLYSALRTCTAEDTIRANQAIRDGSTIVSNAGEFELGFFSPGSSTNRYVGIWYKKKSDEEKPDGTVVWVANRETPVTDTSGVISVNHMGIIVLGGNRTIWSSNSSSRIMMKPIVAQLLDTGNLVLRAENDTDEENFLWQSFDYPVNNMLPGMRFGVNLETGLHWYYTSWKSAEDPSPGTFLHRLDHTGFPQIILWKDSVVWCRTGPWVGSRFSGIPIGDINGIVIDYFVFNKKAIYYKFEQGNKTSPITRLIMKPNGEIQRLVWNNQNQNWMVYVTLQVTDCEHYGFCGAYGICSIDSLPRCKCLKGFVPRFAEKWEAADFSHGCVRRTPLDCGNKDGFKKYSGVKLPDTRYALYEIGMNLVECEKLCLQNCSCAAYSRADIRRGRNGCFLWYNNLIDTTGYTKDGQDIYVRMPASELGTRSKENRMMLITAISVVLTALLALILYVSKKKKQKGEGRWKSSSELVARKKYDLETFELPLFEFTKIKNATKNFSENNKIGEGGFGPVYKGIMEDGHEIAVKRLSENSSQGVDEFKNEVSCIAKLQHRNLVTLLGCCTGNGERMLIYEYMPNKSLDCFIFDPELSKLLDWSSRYNIVNGIARGLLYLHQDSKLRIIHRDLKASNILLDYQMNPKISDFGIAKRCKGNQTEGNTRRVVGTYGYMPPEYAIDGVFSVKSDVYSFGVVVIEIVSGKKNRLFTHPDHSHNLLGHAWRSYKEDNLLELVDGTILESGNHDEVLRIIHIGLLCVQQNPEDRPSMSDVVLLLSSNNALPQPKEPGFFMERKLRRGDRSLNEILSSTSQLTVSVLAPRL